MIRKAFALSLILTGLAGGLVLLSADEPEPLVPVPTDAEAKLLQRIEQLERRVAELERKLAEQQALRFTAIPPDATLRLPPESPALRNLPKHEINGHTFYVVPLTQ